MAKRAAKSKAESAAVYVPDALRDAPRLYSGEFGTFGIGGEIVREPATVRKGFPPVDRDAIPEATDAQYRKIIKKGDHASSGLSLAPDRLDPQGGVEG